jgi:hypothetical protein
MTTYYEMLDGGEHNPYHFLFFMVANFAATEFTSHLVFYYPNKKDCKVAEEFLALLPPNYERHFTKREGIIYKPFNKFIPTFGDFTLPALYKFIRYLYSPHISPRQPGRKIYIQRVPPATRTFSNEEAVSNLVRKLGYESVILENYTIRQQIAIVSSAEYILGAHGAGLAFTVFCHPGTRVVEIYSLPNTEAKHYYHIATCSGFPFFRFQGVDSSGVVDIERLGDFLYIWQYPEVFQLV